MITKLGYDILVKLSLDQRQGAVPGVHGVGGLVSGNGKPGGVQGVRGIVNRGMPGPDNYGTGRASFGSKPDYGAVDRAERRMIDSIDGTEDLGQVLRDVMM